MVRGGIGWLVGSCYSVRQKRDTTVVASPNITSNITYIYIHTVHTVRLVYRNTAHHTMAVLYV